jgi:hypothetical protein
MRERSQAAIFLAAWLAALAALLAVIGSGVPGSPPPPSEAASATMAILGPGWRIEYASSTGNGTVFLFLREASANLGFDVDYVEYGWPYYDVLVTAINGTRGVDVPGHFWQYCLNGEYGTRGALQQTLRDGDAVLWVYAPTGGSELCG